MLRTLLPDADFCHVQFFTKSETCYHLHVCHACLNQLMSELAIAQFSYFVKHHEWIPAMNFFVMFQCCTIFILMHLDGSCCLSQTGAIFVLLAISKPFIRFRWSLYQFRLKSTHLSSGTLGFPSWGQVQSFLSKSCICITYRIPHIMTMFCIMLFEHCTWLIVFLFACCSCLGRARRRVREWGARWVLLRGSRQLWVLWRQDDHTLKITSIFAC